ncbi:MAG: 30S ribosomal protein S12 methylthiotransferase RimO, partial [Candidatus Latescibacteria bacterium]|nr:30S ribosomal protein S12 methylthiotransferase RimO [Candidatus Latescibacterota bacterium]
MPTVNLITLGCPKNTVDSERMHRLLELNGYTVSDEAEGADVIIVNTCGFIEPAKEESISTVLDATEYKESGNCKGVIVTGCLAERYRTELETELTEADLIIGLAGERDIVNHCDKLLGTSRIQTIRDAESRHLLTPKHWAYLRISDGCD